MNNDPIATTAWWRYLLLITGVAAAATAVIFIKASTTSPLLLCAWRQLLAVAILAPLFWGAWRRHADRYSLRHLGRCVLPALMLAAHFISWTIGARRTDAANASLIVNLVPMVMPFLMFFIAREQITRRELTGTLLALLGLVVLGAGSFSLRPEHLPGDAICFGSMLLFALYLVCGRVNRDFPSLWLYVVPIYGISGGCCLVIGAIAGQGLVPTSGKEWLLMLALALVPTVIGHSILNDAMKHLRGQVVSLCNLGQFIFAAIFAYLLLGEIPTVAFAVAAALIVIGAITVIRDQAQPGSPAK